MLRVFLFSALFLLLTSGGAAGQTIQASKPLAPFEIKLTNGKLFTRSELSPGPVILIYFSPDCGHCKDFTKELLNYPDAFKTKQVVMVTFTPLPTVDQFERTLFLQLFPNITVGTEGESYRVMRYYGIRTFPYVALYNRAGKFVKSYEGEQPFKEILKSIVAL